MQALHHTSGNVERIKSYFPRTFTSNILVQRIYLDAYGYVEGTEGCDYRGNLSSYHLYRVSTLNHTVEIHATSYADAKKAVRMALPLAKLVRTESDLIA